MPAFLPTVAAPALLFPPPTPQVLAASFQALDLALDAREYAFPEGERSPDFTGFHRVERLLFGCACCSGGRRRPRMRQQAAIQHASLS